MADVNYRSLLDDVFGLLATALDRTLTDNVGGEWIQLLIEHDRARDPKKNESYNSLDPSRSLRFLQYVRPDVRQKLLARHERGLLDELTHYRNLFAHFENFDKFSVGRVIQDAYLLCRALGQNEQVDVLKQILDDLANGQRSQPRELRASASEAMYGNAFADPKKSNIRLIRYGEVTKNAKPGYVGRLLYPQHSLASRDTVVVELPDGSSVNDGYTLPGRILAWVVKPGDYVEVGDILCVLEQFTVGSIHDRRLSWKERNHYSYFLGSRAGESDEDGTEVGYFHGKTGIVLKLNVPAGGRVMNGQPLFTFACLPGLEVMTVNAQVRGQLSYWHIAVGDEVRSGDHACYIAH